MKPNSLGMILGVVGLWAMPASAEANLEDYLVKVSSRICDRDSVRFHGSGILIEAAGKTYVLTSDHVLLHGNEGYCHEVGNDRFGPVRAELLQADWGAGLALLELHTGPRTGASLEIFRPQPIKKGAMVRSLGFPAASYELVEDREGRVLQVASRRGLIAFVPTMAEVYGAYVEYGMSGGAVVTREQGAFVGMISHQYLKPVPGGEARPANLRAQVASDHLFVVPASYIYQWLTNVLNGREGVLPSAVSDPVMQIAHRDVVYSSGMKFELAAAPVNTDLALSLTGGNDGVGVGGEGSPASFPTVPSTVLISQEQKPHKAALSASLRRGWLASVSEKLLRRNVVEVKYFVSYSSDYSEIEKHPIRSLAHFFQSLGRGDLHPVAIVRQGESLDRQDRDELVAEIRSDALWLESTLEDIQRDLPASPAQEVAFLLGQIGTLASILQTEDVEVIELEWLRQLQAVEGEPWESMFSDDFERTVKLLQSLYRIEAALKKIKV